MLATPGRVGLRPRVVNFLDSQLNAEFPERNNEDMARCALFDLDNTLVDREAVFRRWAEMFVKQHSLGSDAVDWLCMADDDGFAQRHDMLGAVREQFGLKESVDQLVETYWADYVALYRPDSRVTDALTRLRSTGWRIAIVTNGPSSQHEKVARAGLAELVEACCVSGEIGIGKPDGRIFEEALRRCGRLPRDDDPAWMVGDSPLPDIRGGGEAGLRTAWIHRGRQWIEPGYRPDAQVGSVPEAVDVVLAWDGAQDPD